MCARLEAALLTTHRHCKHALGHAGMRLCGQQASFGPDECCRATTKRFHKPFGVGDIHDSLFLDGTRTQWLHPDSLVASLAVCRESGELVPMLCGVPLSV